MAKDKKSFIIYTDSRGMVNKLSNEKAGVLFKTLFSYCDDENPVCEDEVVDMAFEHFKNILKRDLKKYEKIVERNRENGKSGGRPKNPVGYLGTQEKQTEPKKADSDNVTVTVSDNVSDSEILLKKEPKKNIFDFRKSLIEYGFEENLVDDWLKVRKTKKATNTETAFKAFISEIESKYCNINEMLQMSVTNSWSGFKHIWVENLKNINNGNKFSNSSKSDSDIRKEINDSVDKYFA